ncbi:MAG: DUF4296 domain-containing protein, partial [Bacteroidales bacterium]|nr:DUF4296 domain-containing protein [Bacteroidales bacterium]
MKSSVYIISLLFLFLYSCTQTEQKFKKSELIPAKDLVSVLYDLHLADGLLSLSEIRNDYNDMDSLGSYLSILASYGYSLEHLNNTIEHYSSDPETLNEIYEKVITQLTELEVEIKSSNLEKGISIPNLWEGKTSWKLPEDGKQNKLEFEVLVKNPGIYKIIVDIKIYRDDESFEPAITAYFWFDNQTELGHRLYYPKTRITKSGRKRTYRITQKVLNPKITHLKGYLLDHSQK